MSCIIVIYTKMYPQEDGSDEYMAALCGEVVAYLNEALGVEEYE